MPRKCQCNWCEREIGSREVIVIKSAFYDAEKKVFEDKGNPPISVYDPECWEAFCESLKEL